MAIPPTTITDFIFFHARSRPEKPAIILPDRAATYDMLAQGVMRVEDRLCALSLAPGELVCVTIDNAIRHMVVVAALFRLGHPVMAAEKPEDIAPLRLPVRIFLHDTATPMILGVRQILVDDDWFTGERRALPARASNGFACEESICRVDISSGTTGFPKATSSTVSAFHQWISRYFTSIHLGEWDRLLCLPRLAGSWGFRIAAHTLMAGKTIVIAQSAGAALSMANGYRADAIVASTEQLRDLVREQRSAPVPVPSLRVVFTAGGLLTRELIMEARARICNQIINQYGSTEAGQTVCGSADMLADIEGATGYVMPGAELEIVDDQNQQLPPNVEGFLRLRTPWQSRPFPPVGAANHPGFRDGWHYPGDRGHLTANGLLVLTGRGTDVINAGGLKIAPELVEEILLKHPNIAEAAAFGVAGEGGIDEINVAVVTRAAIDSHHLIDWCAAHNLPIARVFTVASLPRTPLGKLRRDELRKTLKP